MDSQQRLLLEVGYQTMHNASLRRGSLLGCDVGVFVGLWNIDFASLIRSTSVYGAPHDARRHPVDDLVPSVDCKRSYKHPLALRLKGGTPEAAPSCVMNFARPSRS